MLFFDNPHAWMVIAANQSKTYSFDVRNVEYPKMLSIDNQKIFKYADHSREQDISTR